jgi:ankyrin repeat protein
MESFLAETDDVNVQSDDLGGATQLWKAAEQGHELAVRAILQHPETDPNMPRTETMTTPLCVAAFYGHDEVVREILRHPAGASPQCCFFSFRRSIMLASPLLVVLTLCAVDVNAGQINTRRSPLIMAAQEGREGVVRELLGANEISIHHADTEGVTAILTAGSHGHGHVVALLQAAHPRSRKQRRTQSSLT